MWTTLFMSAVIMAFLGLVIHLIHKEEKRIADRRQQNQPYPRERRKQERRKKSLLAYLSWVMGSLGFKSES